MSEITQFTEDNVFDDKFKKIIEQYQASGISDELHQQLVPLLLQPKEIVDNEAYLWILYLQGQYFASKDNERGEAYCALRMYLVMESMRSGKNKAYFMEYHNFELSDEIYTYVMNKAFFYINEKKRLNQRLITTILVLSVGISLVLHFFLAFDILPAIGYGVVLGLVSYLFNSRSIYKKYTKLQTDAFLELLSEPFKSFDQRHRNI